MRLGGLAAAPLLWPEHDVSPSTAWAELELGATRPCLRGALVPLPFSAQLSAAHGTLQGVVVLSEQSRPVICRAAAGKSRPRTQSR